MAQPLEGYLAIERLTAGFVDGDRDETTRSPVSQTHQHVLADVFGKGRALPEVETETGPGVGAVGVLSARPTGGAEAPGKLARRDEIGTDLHRRPFFTLRQACVNHFPIAVVMSEGRETPDSSGVGPGPRAGDAVRGPGDCGPSTAGSGSDELGSAGLVNARPRGFANRGNHKRKIRGWCDPGSEGALPWRRRRSDVQFLCGLHQ